MSASRVMFGPVHKNNVAAFRKLVHTVLPVEYSDSFYTGMISTPEDFTKVGA